MQQGISLQALAAKIEANAQLQKDYIADTNVLTMEAQSDGVLALDLPGKGSFPVLPIAHGQIAARNKIPLEYYNRMRTEAPALLAENVNTWFRKQPEKRMLRTSGGDARAFLSNKYQRIDNRPIAQAALPVLSDLPGVTIPSCEVTDKRLYIHFVVPTIEGEVKKGDIVQCGGIISNSEVGFGRYSVCGLAWRLICLNGMKTGEQFSRNHVGRRIEDDEMLWAEDTQQADDKAILLKIRDMVRSVVDETKFRATVLKMQGLTEARMTGDPTKAVELLADRVGASEGERGGILRSLIEGADLTAWGLLNAVTAQAHTAGNYDRAVELESAGGQLLELAPGEWKTLLAAE